MAGGRPTKYKPEYVQQAEKLCALGATDSEMADFFEVTISTFSLWKVKHPEFSEALKGGKDIADRRVETALYNRAMGYSHEETDVRVVDGAVVMTPMIKHYPPDTTAAIFWLKNRKPQEWRDKRETELSGGVSVTHLSDEDLERRIAELS
ncbi:terminase [Pseudomonas sp. MSSRFD41]|uniref:terminase n=1 Tax=Pseudomonas sp. MSSRFD41 TaxID=1310370 RepID=UPI00163AE82B|nr:terminase [Pseudomonas sp. MSSRFD41]MBC2659739.1 terminase [Pseudomonas sp. MSSRFD41]